MPKHPSELPHDHPSNLDEKGQPKMSENAWALKQSVDSGNWLSIDMMKWSTLLGRTPSSIHELLEMLHEAMDALQPASADILPASNDAHSQEYISESALHWPETNPRTSGAALDEVARLTAVLRSGVGEIASDSEGFDADHWVDPKPTTVMEALNRIAARLNAGGTGPID